MHKIKKMGGGGVTEKGTKMQYFYVISKNSVRGLMKKEEGTLIFEFVK